MSILFGGGESLLDFFECRHRIVADIVAAYERSTPEGGRGDAGA